MKKLDPQIVSRGEVLAQVDLAHETKDAVKAQRLAALIAKAKAAMQAESLVVTVLKMPRPK